MEIGDDREAPEETPACALMDVYLLPVGPDRHELYCEVSSPVHTDAEPSSSIWGRMTHAFRRAVDEGEQARSGDVHPRGGRVRRAITRKLAEAVAEQRLLWHLRRQSHARLLHPDDMPPAAALERSRAIITADRDKHKRRALINAGLLVLSGPIALVPGPNVLAYYFAFRTVGHWLSKRGAEQGLSCVSWSPAPCPPLTELRNALRLEAAERSRRVDEIAGLLGLERLPLFVRGVADRPA
jgi:hypothetical protein